MNARRNKLAFACGALVAAIAAPTTASAGEKVDWVVAPYLWLPTITVDLASERPPVGGGGGGQEDFFPEIFDDLDGAFLGYAEVQGDHWGAFANVLFIGLSSDEDFAIADTESDIDATVIDAAAVYSFDSERFAGFELYGGLRYVDIDYRTDITFTNTAIQPRTASFEDSYSDFLFGGRYRGSWSDRWGYTIELDGSTGDTEGTWSTSARIQYRTGNGAWVFGWRYLDGEIEATRESLDITLNGPVIGYAFRF
ncbi:MAG TPA: hypothetical protein VFL14_13080 [Xanthomonadales bacterium]|nr:hypothetical protein [Xanthomonadales bacterium]